MVALLAISSYLILLIIVYSLEREFPVRKLGSWISDIGK